MKSQKGSIVEHEKAFHKGVTYPCGQCSQQFSQKGSLVEHKKSFHEGAKYPCGQFLKFNSNTNSYDDTYESS